ncbi:metallophosphoesterase 1-like [Tripterygium wilfordii]|uniref:Metallophosphoesterase 1-like n=1 Tax=Tripterygium wilfordii TaxID=458696 RepID=A0A7J7D1N5_TRIWF|nr:metallophosphoesterase 1-like [Tripterygium wilfordii]KAF5740244.1 metallophosphoesterase 1-like [Tripterygium wilfordii]
MALGYWRPLLPLLCLSCLLLYEEWASISSCKIVPGKDPDDYSRGKVEASSDDLKVMIVANLHLQGSEAGLFDLYFRDYYLSKFFRKSFQSLNPDMLIVLGDVSARGSELTKSKWVSVLNQFHKMLGPFLGLPFHVVLGDRDIGECGELDANFVQLLAASFPGLDSAGCGAFEISNTTFVSVNAVALLCDNNEFRFSVEKVIERESIDLQMENEGAAGIINEFHNFRETSHHFELRENDVLPGSGPVLLLHFPLNRRADYHCNGGRNAWSVSRHSQQNFKKCDSRQFIGAGPYDLLQTVPANATEYIFQALRPRFIFSAHSHEFCDITHSDGTREITVPAMTWKAKDDPGFVVATFGKDRKGVSVSYCALARESHVLATYTTLLVSFVVLWFISKAPHSGCLRR